jgi:hypothetical protein
VTKTRNVDIAEVLRDAQSPDSRAYPPGLSGMSVSEAATRIREQE